MCGLEKLLSVTVFNFCNGGINLKCDMEDIQLTFLFIPRPGINVSDYYQKSGKLTAIGFHFSKISV